MKWLFEQGCTLVVLACNTASAKALRTIQQKDLPKIDAAKRVLGVIRPTTEIIGQFSKTGNVGILATNGTVIPGHIQLRSRNFIRNYMYFSRHAPCGCHWWRIMSTIHPGPITSSKKIWVALTSVRPDRYHFTGMHPLSFID